MRISAGDSSWAGGRGAATCASALPVTATGAASRQRASSRLAICLEQRTQPRRKRMRPPLRGECDERRLRGDEPFTGFGIRDEVIEGNGPGTDRRECRRDADEIVVTSG